MKAGLSVLDSERFYFGLVVVPGAVVVTAVEVAPALCQCLCSSLQTIPAGAAGALGGLNCDCTSVGICFGGAAPVALSCQWPCSGDQTIPSGVGMSGFGNFAGAAEPCCTTALEVLPDAPEVSTFTQGLASTLSCQ